MRDSKTRAKRIWSPSSSSVEEAPNRLEVAHERPGVMGRPHWHAQVEVNYVLRGTIKYSMRDHELRLAEGDLCLFWGGLPHQLTDTTAESDFVAIHLPLVHFFRLRLPGDVRNRLMNGATLVIPKGDRSDDGNFVRWTEYMQSGDPVKCSHAIDELLLRIERINFEPNAVIETGGPNPDAEPEIDHQSFRNIQRICSYVAEHFRDDIDSSMIASSVDIHPKYAMNIFKKSTGMTLNEFVNLIRLSYAQALLMKDECSILSAAMESGFGSLSAFNSSFRKISGVSPSTFRRDLRLVYSDAPYRVM